MTIHIPNMKSPSANALNDLASWLGQQLPATYVSFVRQHDGAEPPANSLATSGNEVGVSRFIPVAEAAKLAEQIDGFPLGVVPLAEDDSGNFFYVEPQSGSIRFWDHEIEGEDEVVASDISDFLIKLTPFDTTKVKLAPGQDLGGWVDPSFKPEF